MTDRELDVLVAEKVMGWEKKPWRDSELWFDPLVGQYAYEVPRYTTSADDDYTALEKVRSDWPDEPGGKWKIFCENLHDLYWPRKKHGWNTLVDNLGMYRPGDYSRAALLALGVEVDQ